MTYQKSRRNLCVKISTRFAKMIRNVSGLASINKLSQVRHTMNMNMISRSAPTSVKWWAQEWAFSASLVISNSLSTLLNYTMVTAIFRSKSKMSRAVTQSMSSSMLLEYRKSKILSQSLSASNVSSVRTRRPLSLCQRKSLNTQRQGSLSNFSTTERSIS